MVMPLSVQLKPETVVVTASASSDLQLQECIEKLLLLSPSLSPSSSPTQFQSGPLISDPTSSPCYSHPRVHNPYVQPIPRLGFTCTISPAVSTSACSIAGAWTRRRWLPGHGRRGPRTLASRSSTALSTGWWVRFCMKVAKVRRERRLGYWIRKWLTLSLCPSSLLWVSILMAITWPIQELELIINCRYSLDWFGKILFFQFSRNISWLVFGWFLVMLSNFHCWFDNCHWRI